MPKFTIHITQTTVMQYQIKARSHGEAMKYAEAQLRALDKAPAASKSVKSQLIAVEVQDD